MVTHGQSGTRLYKIWADMKNRCNSPTNHAYANYGGRGIAVCDKWNQFEPFYEWAVTSGYEDGLTIDRIDVDGDYTPSNCKWSTYSEQNNNQRRTHYLEKDGVVQSEMQWAKALGIPSTTIKNRLRRGWSVERALNEPVQTKFRHKDYHVIVEKDEK